MGAFAEAATLLIGVGFLGAALTAIFLTGVDFLTGVATFLGAAFLATGLAVFFAGADFLIGLADVFGDAFTLFTAPFLATGLAALTTFFRGVFLAAAFEAPFF
jgi:hypothetical protein